MACDALWYVGYQSSKLEKLKRLVADMNTLLYPGCNEKWTKLFASVKLLQLKATRHMTDHCFKAMLHLIPMTTYDSKQNVCPLGLEVEKLHACKNDCVLFRDDNADLKEYPRVAFLGTNEDFMVVMTKRKMELSTWWHGVFQ
jgi:hypothetical protein